MRIYFAGIGGTALAPLANLALDAGHQVLGTDPHPNSEIDKLKQRGALYNADQSGKWLEKVAKEGRIDWLVQTSAMTDDHPELETARRLGIKVTKRDQLIAKFIEEYNWKMIAVAGTHGKTTTTAMLIWLFHKLGIDISYLVGSSLPFAPAGKFTPNSQYFVYECDEYDRNFLHFYPKYSLIPSISHDHVDIFPTKETYDQAFLQFLKQSEEAWLWQTNQRSPFDQLTSLHFIDQIDPGLSLLGQHNRANATLVLTLADYLKLADKKTVVDILNHTPRPGRRFEILRSNVVSDYAHHPEEIAATIDLACEYRQQHSLGRIVIIYQPHQNSRQNQFRADYASVFQKADRVYWLPTFLTREDPNLAILTPEELSTSIANATTASLDESFIQRLQQHVQANDLLVFMSAGSLDEWLRAHLDQISPSN